MNNNSGTLHLLAGVGDLNQRVGRRLLDSGQAVLGLRRRPADPALGFEQRSLDLAAEPWPDVGAETVIVALSAAERTPDGYRRAYVEPLRQLAASMTTWQRLPRRVLVVGSSRVFGVNDGRELCEDSPINPDGWAGETLAEMEAQAAALPVPATVARLSGIYGPGRDWLRRLARRADREPPQTNHWTNRIHIDDAAAALVHLALKVDDADGCYLVTDRQPAPLCEVLTYLRRQEDLPALTDVPPIGGGKRLRSNRLAATGFRWQYPHYRAGGYRPD